MRHVVMINRMFGKFCRFSVIIAFLSLSTLILAQSKNGKWTIRAMEYNVENLFDCKNDTLKDDSDFLPEGTYQWTPSKYWRKLNAVARGIVLASSETGTLHLPDLVALCEVENDSVLHSLTKRSLLRTAGYEYVMTESPDVRGVDVALMYLPSSFRLQKSYGIRVNPVPGMRPTRDILYAKGDIRAADSDSELVIKSLHVFVVHAPSRRGGERTTRPHRQAVVRSLMHSVDSIRTEEPNALMLIMGDFNDYADGVSIRQIVHHAFVDVSTSPFITTDTKVKGTYKYQGEWGSLDHVLVSGEMSKHFVRSFVGNHPDILEEDTKYGGVMPYRFFRGSTMHGGFSDHLPLIVDFAF